MKFRTYGRKLPDVDSTFIRIFKDKKYIMTVVKQNTEIAFKVGQVIYDSPTAAARSIYKNQVNGWRFWKMNKKK